MSSYQIRISMEPPWTSYRRFPIDLDGGRKGKKEALQKAEAEVERLRTYVKDHPEAVEIYVVLSTDED
jgi:hypothetical protein